MTRRLAIAASVAGLVGLLPGCAAFGPGDATAVDGGPRVELPDGGARGADGSLSVGDAASDDGGPAAPTGLAEDACFDFTDDDGDSAADCRDPGCMVSAICCATGSSAAECCRGGAVGGLPIESCAPGDPVGCGAATARFGARAPAIVAGITRSDACGTSPVVGLEPGGSEAADGGVFVGEPIDPSVARVTLSATLGARLGGSSLDAIGVGLTAQADVQGRVLPLVAILLSATDAELRVVVGDAVVATASLGSVVSSVACGASEVAVELEVLPDGTFTARAVRPGTTDAVDLATGELPRARSARIVVFGRGDVPGADGPAAWLSSLSIDRRVCSATDPGRDEEPVLGAGWTVSPRSTGRVTVLPEQGLAAVLVDGRVYPGSLDASGDVVIPDPGVANAIVRPMGAYAGGVSDPELVVDGGRLYLLFAGRATADGEDSIYSLPFASFDLGDVAGSPEPILTPAGINAASVGLAEPPAEVLSVDSPSFFVHGGSGHLLVRVHTAAGTELRILDRAGGLETAGAADSSAPGGVTRADSPSTTAYRLHANRDTDPTAFDRDELGAAQLIDLGDGVLRVLYSGRSGTRWGIGMLVSADRVHFDFATPFGAPILVGDGVGFDALSVRDPEPAATPVASGVAELRIWYTGSDGLRSRVGLGSQSIAVVGGAP